MIIHSPTQSISGADILTSARVEFESGKPDFPPELWFRFPRAFGGQVSADADPFATALLLLAMQRNEPLRVRGPLSRKLGAGLREYSRLYHSWFPKRFHLIAIEADSWRDDASAGNARSAAFSGGVDSFYTLLKLRDAGEPLTHALFMAGFDMPLNLTWSIGELTRSFAQLAEEIGIRLVTGSTNVRAFVNPVDWTNAHGQALAASALFFKRSWGKFHIPASYTHGSSPKWGTHPDLDALLSTESLEFRHHGAEANRVAKLARIIRAPESFDRLRVCWIQDIGLRNCGECEKCVRTAIALDLLGALENYRTFAPGALTGAKIRALPQRTHQSRLFAGELIGEALRRRKFAHGRDLAYSLAKRALRYYGLPRFTSR